MLKLYKKGIREETSSGYPNERRSCIRVVAPSGLVELAAVEVAELRLHAEERTKTKRGAFPRERKGRGS